MRSFSWLLVTLLALLVVASPATACLNDRESLQSEKEFKSGYIEIQTPAQPAPSPASPTDQLLVFGGSGIGVSLLIGACVVCLVRTRKD